MSLPEQSGRPSPNCSSQCTILLRSPHCNLSTGEADLGWLKRRRTMARFSNAARRETVSPMLPHDSVGPTRDELTAASTEAMFQRLGASSMGLNGDEALDRLSQFGANELKATSPAAVLTLPIGQFKSPIIIILIGAAILAAILQDTSDARNWKWKGAGLDQRR